MKKPTRYSAIALMAGALAAGVASADNWGGPGEGCPHHRMMLGQGGPGMAQGRGPAGFNGERPRMRRDLNLSADQVRTLVEARLIMRGNDRLKVGSVTPDGKDAYKVKIVTVDGSLVREFHVDKHRGLRPRHHHFR